MYARLWAGGRSFARGTAMPGRLRSACIDSCIDYSGNGFRIVPMIAGRSIVGCFCVEIDNLAVTQSDVGLLADSRRERACSASLRFREAC